MTPYDQGFSGIQSARNRRDTRNVIVAGIILTALIVATCIWGGDLLQLLHK